MRKFILLGLLSSLFSCQTAQQDNSLDSSALLESASTFFEEQPDEFSYEQSGLQLRVMNGVIKKIISDGKGGLYITGNFSKVMDIKDNLVVSKLVHVLPNGLLNTEFKIKTDEAAEIYDLGLFDDGVVVVGKFSNINEIPRNNIAVLDHIGRPTMFYPKWKNGVVNSVEVHGKSIYIGGVIDDKSTIAVYSMPFGKDVTSKIFSNKKLIFNGDKISDIVIKDQNLYAAGNFQTLSYSDTDYPIAGFVKFDLKKIDFTDWKLSIANSAGKMVVSKILVDNIGKRLFIAGSFNQVGKSTKLNVASIDMHRDTLNDEFNAIKLNGEINDIYLDQNRLIAGGNFNIVNNRHETGMAFIDANSGDEYQDERVKIHLTSELGQAQANVIFPWRDDFIVGGQFNSINNFSGPYYNLFDVGQCDHCYH